MSGTFHKRSLILVVLFLLLCFSESYADMSKSVDAAIVNFEVTPPVQEAIESLNSPYPFTVTVKPSDITIDSYKWLTEGAWPPTAGNSPELDYESPTSESTYVRNTRWFAKTPSYYMKIDGTICSYTINCEVTVDGKTYKTDESGALRVGVALEPSYCVGPGFSDWGTIEISNVGGTYVITGKGNFRRDDPEINVATPATSQFYGKIMAHELAHYQQWQTFPGSDLWNADKLYAWMQANLSSTVSEADLRSKINAAVDAQDEADFGQSGIYRCQNEQEAFDAWNAADPPYLYMVHEDWAAAENCP